MPEISQPRSSDAEVSRWYFDRAFESVSGDYGWNPERSRNISVDMRYVLWILEQVQPAPHLLREMGL